MTVADLALFAGGFTAIGAAIGAGVYHLALPWVLARRGLPAVHDLLGEVERHVLAKRRRLRPVRRGRHLEGRS